MTAHAVVERKEPDTQAAVQHEQPGVSIMALVSQAVSAGLPMETIRELRTMAKEEAAEIAERAFNQAMGKAQAEMRMVEVNKTNTQTKSRYATYDALDKILRPIYSKHGFSVSFDEGDTDKPDHVRMLCYVSHVGGHTRTYRKDIPADGKGAKGGDVMTKTHAAGAASSYGMRYLQRMIWNVAVGEDDTDGNMPADTVTEKQVMDLNDLIDVAVQETNSSRVTFTKRFLAYMKAERIEDIPAAQYRRAVEAINSTRPRR